MYSSLMRSEEHTSELQSQSNLVCRLLLEKKKQARRRLSPRPPALGAGAAVPLLRAPVCAHFDRRQSALVGHPAFHDLDLERARESMAAASMDTRTSSASLQT